MTKYGNKKGARIREHMHSQLKVQFSHDPCVWNPACCGNSTIRLEDGLEHPWGCFRDELKI